MLVYFYPFADVANLPPLSSPKQHGNKCEVLHSHLHTRAQNCEKGNHAYVKCIQDSLTIMGKGEFAFKTTYKRKKRTLYC